VALKNKARINCEASSRVDPFGTPRDQDEIFPSLQQPRCDDCLSTFSPALNRCRTQSPYLSQHIRTYAKSVDHHPRPIPPTPLPLAQEHFSGATSDRPSRASTFPCPMPHAACRTKNLNPNSFYVYPPLQREPRTRPGSPPVKHKHQHQWRQQVEIPNVIRLRRTGSHATPALPSSLHPQARKEGATFTV